MCNNKTCQSTQKGYKTTCDADTTERNNKLKDSFSGIYNSLWLWLRIDVTAPETSAQTLTTHAEGCGCWYFLRTSISSMLGPYLWVVFATPSILNPLLRCSLNAHFTPHEIVPYCPEYMLHAFLLSQKWVPLKTDYPPSQYHKYLHVPNSKSIQAHKGLRSSCMVATDATNTHSVQSAGWTASQIS